MNKKVKILRGIPGCGKSTYTKGLKAEWRSGPFAEDRSYTECSADNHFIGEDGVYRFDARRLGTAHASCLRLFTKALTENDLWHDHLIVVDNTNTTVRELSTYVDLCKAWNIPFEIVTIDTPPEIAAHRNTHGVPVEKVYQMHKRLKDAQIPQDWPHVVIPGVI